MAQNEQQENLAMAEQIYGLLSSRQKNFYVCIAKKSI